MCSWRIADSISVKCTSTGRQPIYPYSFVCILDILWHFLIWPSHKHSKSERTTRIWDRDTAKSTNKFQNNNENDIHLAVLLVISSQNLHALWDNDLLVSSVAHHNPRPMDRGRLLYCPAARSLHRIQKAVIISFRRKAVLELMSVDPILQLRSHTHPKLHLLRYRSKTIMTHLSKQKKWDKEEGFP